MDHVENHSAHTDSLSPHEPPGSLGSRRSWGNAWGSATAVLHRAPRVGWGDLLVVLFLAAMLFALLDVERQWASPRRLASIDLSLWSLPHYTFFSLTRGVLAYLISLVFTLVYGYWAAKSPLAAKVLVPLLDILQSLPVLAFLPGLLLTLEAAFPRSNIGLEMAAILMIFTGQAWNMTFSFYHSLRSVPNDFQEAARLFHFTAWQRLKWVELPFATMGLVWNSMMSMAGGWFFLMINESFELGHRDFRLPGVGSYMKAAVDQGRYDAMLAGMAAMLIMITLLDQLLWRPMVIWAQKFRVEEGAQLPMAPSWINLLLRRSQLLQRMTSARHQRQQTTRRRLFSSLHSPRLWQRVGGGMRWIVTAAVLVVVGVGSIYGLWRLVKLIAVVTVGDWLATALAAAVTLARVMTATALGTLWAVPAGIAIGLSPRVSRWMQPIIQIAASFPAPMLFPVVILILQSVGISLGWGGIVLMMLGTQWYILFNVIAGAMAIPSDLLEAARSYRFNLWLRWRIVYGPAVFPYLVTGWITAAGGAWNASIVAEYITFRGETLQAFGLGRQISVATVQANFPLLAVSVIMMSCLVVLFNRLVWRQLYRLAERRFSLSK